MSRYWMDEQAYKHTMRWLYCCLFHTLYSSILLLLYEWSLINHVIALQPQPLTVHVPSWQVLMDIWG